MTDERAGAEPPRYRWVVCGLLFAATTVNYMDRQLLGILKQPLVGEMGWSELDYSRIVIAFQVAYALGLPAFGWLIDRWGTRLGYALAMAWWSAAAMAHAAAGTLAGFCGVRALLGLGEAGNFPAANVAVAQWHPPRERALAVSLFNAGANVGAMLAPVLVPLLAARWGWRGAFIAVGASGFLWLLAWWPLSRRAPPPPPADEPAAPPSWASLLRQRQTWAIIAAKALTDPIWWFLLFWLPGWLMARYRIDLRSAGLPLFTVYAMATVGAIAAARLAGVLAARLGQARARRRVLLLCACAVVPIAAAASVEHLWLAVALVGLAAAAHQGWSANVYALIADLVPRRAVGAVSGIGGMAGALGSIAFAEFTGRVLDGSGAWWLLFAIAAAAYLAAFAIINLLLPRPGPAA